MVVEDNGNKVKLTLTFEEAEKLFGFIQSVEDGDGGCESDWKLAAKVRDKLDEYLNT